MTQECKCTLLDRLEAERNDLSYKNKPEPTVIPIRTVKVSTWDEKRDKLMFNAGRYAAGARDKTAMEANLKLEKELS